MLSNDVVEIRTCPESAYSLTPWKSHGYVYHVTDQLADSYRLTILTSYEFVYEVSILHSLKFENASAIFVGEFISQQSRRRTNEWTRGEYGRGGDRKSFSRYENLVIFVEEHINRYINTHPYCSEGWS